MKTIAIILGSTRKNALGRRLFNYLKQLTAETTHATTQFTFLDLTNYHLPFFDDPLPPMANSQRDLQQARKTAEVFSLPPMANSQRDLPANQQQWLDDIAAADGYIFLTPEYNHAEPAVLKNALDFLAFEAQHKPAKLISYSDNLRGGQFGAAALVPILQRLGIVVLPKPTPVGNVQATLQPDGQLIANAPLASRYRQGLSTALNEINYYTTVLTDHPFKA